MGGRRILTDEQIDEMATLREQGRTFRQLVQHFKKQGIYISDQALRWQCLCVGADGPPGRRFNASTRPGEVLCSHRNGKPFQVRRYTEDEDARLLALEREGLSCREIGKRLDPVRAPNSVKGRLLTLARRETRQEEAEGVSA